MEDRLAEVARKPARIGAKAVADSNARAQQRAERQAKTDKMRRRSTIYLIIAGLFAVLVVLIVLWQATTPSQTAETPDAPNS